VQEQIRHTLPLQVMVDSKVNDYQLILCVYMTYVVVSTSWKFD